MEIWLKLSILLCVFGFVKEFRPSEPFITPYLTGEWKNFTDQVISDSRHLMTRCKREVCLLGL
jgi:thiamine transporter 2/3